MSARKKIGSDQAKTFWDEAIGSKRRCFPGLIRLLALKKTSIGGFSFSQLTSAFNRNHVPTFGSDC
ncbi:MAG: hypothetical protein DMG05_17630 [Acidobacteria bacterium]|nr:MAG: hypothetical protein DMG05_17630 [Acidobacteriota bacterium]